MKFCYGPLILVALLAWMAGCDDMQQTPEPSPPPAQPDTNEPALPDSAVPPAGQLPAEDQSSRFPGPGSYFEQPADQPSPNAESPPPSEFNTGDFPTDANERAGIPTNDGSSGDAGSLFENEVGGADAPGAANDADVNGEGNEAVLPEFGQP